MRVLGLGAVVLTCAACEAYRLPASVIWAILVGGLGLVATATSVRRLGG